MNEGLLTIQYIGFGFILSLLGSIPIGMITLLIIQRTIEHGSKAGLWVGVGATIAEFVYTVVALKFVRWLLLNQQISQGIKLVSLVIFLLLSVYYLFVKGNSSKTPKIIIQKTSPNHFRAGIVIGFLNMLIIPFWIVMGAMVEEQGLPLKDQKAIFIFSSAAALGALVVFIGYVRLARVIVSKMQWAIKYTDRIVGVLFLALAIFQMVSLII